MYIIQVETKLTQVSLCLESLFSGRKVEVETKLPQFTLCLESLFYISVCASKQDRRILLHMQLSCKWIGLVLEIAVMDWNGLDVAGRCWK